tara:strand:- start:1353 stop:1703 length:351 start_codon:yes stop_codon:yes gene_type:complete
MSINVKEVLEFVKDKTVQQIFVYVLIGIFGFFAGTKSVKPCIKDVVCEDIMKDNGKLTLQLSKERVRCQEEKTKALQDLRLDLNADCAGRVEKALQDCEFDQELHCGICVARGICQ